MIKKIVALSLLVSSGQLFAMTCNIQSEVLLIKQSLAHGAPVQSVAWCCDFELYDAPYAAIGGYSGTDDKFVRVYNLEGTSACCTGQLVEKDSLPNTTISTPESYVYAVDWCCTDQSFSFLAVGGADKKVHIYSYDGDSLSYKVSFTHGGAIYDVKWLCGCCEGQENPILAIAGEKGDNGNEIRILEFDENAGTIIELPGALFGNTVYSIDWCCGSADGASVAYLAAGGKPGFSGGTCGDINVRVYCYNCSAKTLSPSAIMSAKPSPVYAVRWCCDPTQRIQRKLAVGGSKDADGITAEVFFLQHNKLIRIGEGVIAQEKIFAIDWNPECPCNHLTLGGGCKEAVTCESNIFVYDLIKCVFTNLFSTRFDDNITSLAWCYDEENSRSYLLVGSEKDGWSHSDICVDETTDDEVALYCAAFCGTQGVVPTPACQRSRRR